MINKRMPLATVYLFAFLSIGTVTNTESVRVISKDELSTKTGKNGTDIWLSILGEVYNVSSGNHYYAEGSGYHVFAGRDASVPFVTGVFTEDEALKGLGSLTPRQLYMIDDWRTFYEKEEKYNFIGVLEGELFDSKGMPTPDLLQFRDVIKEERLVVEQGKKERQERIAQRRANVKKQQSVAKNVEL